MIRHSSFSQRFGSHSGSIGKSRTLCVAVALACLSAGNAFAGEGLASSQVAAVGLGSFVATAGVAMGIYLKFRNWEKSLKGEGEKREIGPQPFRVVKESPFATHEDLEKLRQQHEKAMSEVRHDVRALTDSMQSMSERLTAEGSRRAEAIYHKIDEGNARFADMMNSINTRLTESVGVLKGEIRKRSRA